VYPNPRGQARETPLTMLHVDALKGRAWLRPLLLALVVYAATLAVRLGDLPKWDYDALRVDNEYIMATHDAYAWLAGAYGVGTGTGTPLARMARAYADLTGRPAGEFAFFAPAFGSSLVAVAVLLWAWTLGGLEAGLGAGFMAALAPGFYFRTRLGYYDTDIATLLFPVLQSWMVAHWLAPHLRRPLDLLRGRPDAHAGDEPAPASLAWPLAAGLLVRLGGADWHSHLPDFNLGVACLALVLVLVLGRPGARPRLAWGLVLLGLAGFHADLGLGLAMALAAFLHFAPRRAAPALRRLGPPLVAAALVLGMAAANHGVAGKALEKFRVYSKPTVEAVEGANQSGSPAAPAQAPDASRTEPPVYPGITQSVVEAQNVSTPEVLSQILARPWLARAGMAGFLLVLFFRPVAAFLAPLLGLALLGSVLGARMTMFGGPAAALGVFLPVAWGVKRLTAGRAWGPWAGALASAVLAAVLVGPLAADYGNLAPTPILNKPHAVALKALAKAAPEGSRIWTWWDWGYASQYYARRMSFADGARHSGEYLYPLAVALTTASPLQASQVIAFSALWGYAPWTEWNKRSGQEVNGFMGFIAHNRFAERPKEKQYLVAAWENLRLIPWISYYGTWNAATGQGVHGVSQSLDPNFQVDDAKGILTMSGGGTVPLASADLLTAQGRTNEKFSAPRGAHLVVNRVAGQAFIMDDLAYNSMMVQMLISPPNNPFFQGAFRLVYDGFPMVRIYEAL